MRRIVQSSVACLDVQYFVPIILQTAGQIPPSVVAPIEEEDYLTNGTNFGAGK